MSALSGLGDTGPEHATEATVQFDRVARRVLELATLNVPMAELLGRIRAGYVEMPGLKLTKPQARRLWALGHATCDTVLAALVKAKVLSRTPEGLFVMARGHSASTTRFAAA